MVGDNHKTVYLDAGHGGIDPGGVGTTEAGQTIYESDVNLAIVLDTMALLRDHGYRVVVSRSKDTTVLRLGPADTDEGVLSELGSHDDVAARDVCANLARANLLVGVYQDAGGTQQNAGSVTVYDPDRPFSNDNLKLANLLQGDVLSAMNAHGWQIPNDGVQPDRTFGSAVGNPSSNTLAAEAASYNHLMLLGPAASGYFSTPSQMPGAVIEPLYLTDPFEGTIAASAWLIKGSSPKGSPTPLRNISLRLPPPSPDSGGERCGGADGAAAFVQGSTLNSIRGGPLRPAFPMSSCGGGPLSLALADLEEMAVRIAEQGAVSASQSTGSVRNTTPRACSRS